MSSIPVATARRVREAGPPGSSGARVGLHALLGALVGILVLHPTTMAIYWLEFRVPEVDGGGELARMLLGRLLHAFTPAMLPMTGVLAAIGGVVGLAFGAYHRALARRERLQGYLERELARDLPSVLGGGEGEKVEFKSSARWDLRERRVNRELAKVLARTLAGLLNRDGGSALVGVDDAGRVVGLAEDYQSLKPPDRDGWERFLMSIVRQHLGADACAYLHPVFMTVEGRELCRIVVEPARRPVTYRDGDVSRFYLRMGNSTRELDAQETLDYVARRWPRWLEA